jgi:hypothetical protein
MLPSPTGRLVALAGLSIALGACTTSGSSGSSGPAPTMVSVDPSAFLGDVACSAAPGALRSYVATLVDVTDPTEPFTLPSAQAVACSLPTGFYFVLPGHTYLATVDGYEAPADELVPCGGATSGARRMLPKGKTDCARDAVAPRWTAACGQATGTAAVSAEFANVLFGACDALVDHGASDTAIVVDPTSALGALTCRGDGGEGDVAELDVIPVGGVGAPVTRLSCGAPPLRLASGIEAGVTYAFLVAGRATAGATPTWGSICRVTAEAGRTMTAACDPLTAEGGVRIDVPGLLAGAKLACADGAPSVRVTSVTRGGAPVAVQAPAGRCDEAALVGPLPAGSYEIALRVDDAQGHDVLPTTCTATVEPGLLATATCAAKP